MNNNFGIIELYCGESGKIGYYNNQELGICKAMQGHGFNCFIFYPDKDITEINEENYDGVTVVRCPATSFGVHGKYDWNILKKYNISYAQIDGDNQLYVKDVSNYCDHNNIKYYYYLGTIKTDSDNFIKKIIGSYITRRNISLYRNHKCFVKSKELYKELKNNDINDIEIVNVGLDLSIIPDIDIDRKQLDIPEDKKILLYVGRLENYKRPLDMFNVIKELSDDYYGVMIGDGSLSEYVDNTISNDFKDKIKHISRVENKDIHKYYKVSDYFLNFNEKEIFGMSMLEAMYQGCNVIAIKSPGAEEIIDSDTGYLVDDLNQMINIINSNQSKNIDDMKNRIINNFSWDRNVLKFVEYLKS